MPKSEADWKAESDAHTLAEAEVIKTDKSRNSAAKKAAKKIATDQNARAAAMNQVAAGKTSKPVIKKKPATRKAATRKSNLGGNPFGPVNGG